MKSIYFFLAVLLCGCSAQKEVSQKNRTETITPEKNDDGEWDLEVLDINFQNFLNTRAKPITQYSETFLKSKNRFLVTEWNALYISGKYPTIIESTIDYDPQENYGINFEYKLYQVFVFVRWKYGLRLNDVSSADVL